MISTRSVWPSTTDRPRRTLERYCSPPTSRVCWTGWITIFVAYTASDLRIFTFSSMPAFAFARMLPSIRRMANPISSAKPGQIIAAACRFPTISITSPETRFSFFIASTLSRAMPRLASLCAASLTVTSKKSVSAIAAPQCFPPLWFGVVTYKNTSLGSRSRKDRSDQRPQQRLIFLKTTLLVYITSQISPVNAKPSLYFVLLRYC